jgi:cytochrome c peroxidase
MSTETYLHFDDIAGQADIPKDGQGKGDPLVLQTAVDPERPDHAPLRTAKRHGAPHCRTNRPAGNRCRPGAQPTLMMVSVRLRRKTWSEAALAALPLAGLMLAASAAAPNAAKKSNRNVAISGDAVLLKLARTWYQPLPAATQPAPGTSQAAAVKLGKMLFHDPRLSKSGLISCNTCHNLANYGVDGLPTSLGHGFVAGSRNAPTVFNAALHTRQFWDGRAENVEEQALGPILNPKEMAMPASEAVIGRISTIPEYVALFKTAYPKQKNPVTYDNVGNAIGAFERRLLTPSRFDRFLQGDAKVLSAREKRGLKRFLEIGCATCHAGPAMGGMVFQKFELPDRKPGEGDLGRYEFTRDPNDKYVFKAYSLRNITRTYPYFHDGSVWDLNEAVRLMGKIQHNRDMPKTEIADIVAFLESTTGQIPRFALELPVLPPSRKNTPRPSFR